MYFRKFIEPERIKIDKMSRNHIKSSCLSCNFSKEDDPLKVGTEALFAAAMMKLELAGDDEISFEVV